MSETSLASISVLSLANGEFLYCLNGGLGSKFGDRADKEYGVGDCVADEIDKRPVEGE